VSLARWWSRKADPDSAVVRAARDHWRRIVAPDERAPLAALRFSVVDTETTGLDPYRAELLSIGTCRIEHGAISLTDSLEISVRPRAPSEHENVLVHGIGHAQQAAGEAQAEALGTWLLAVTPGVLVGYHALFDATVLARAARESLDVRLPVDWLDIALLLPALTAEPASRIQVHPLDYWLEHLDVASTGRHGAAADAYATAQLLLVVLHRAQARGIQDVRGLRRLQQELLTRLANQAGGGTGA
jgi:DNA polymerase III subunit epsilon